MSEAPKKIWYNFEWGREIVRGMDEDDIQYIRSDLVDELVKLLEAGVMVDFSDKPVEWFEWRDKSMSAIKNLDEQ